MCLNSLYVTRGLRLEVIVFFCLFAYCYFFFFFENLISRSQLNFIEVVRKFLIHLTEDFSLLHFKKHSGPSDFARGTATILSLGEELNFPYNDVSLPPQVHPGDYYY